MVFADIGTSVYYAPGILYGRVRTRTALFVAMTLVVFVLLAIKYAEVAIRYPGGGGWSRSPAGPSIRSPVCSAAS